MAVVRDVELRRRRLDATFKRAQKLRGVAELEEIEAEYARHLCVLISGYVERAVAEIILEYAKGKTARPLLGFVETNVRRLRNLDRDRLLAIVGSLDAQWRNQMDAYLVDERQAALNSVVGLRNDIAHGGSAPVSFRQVEKYWLTVQEIVDKTAEVLLAEPRSATAAAKGRR